MREASERQQNSRRKILITLILSLVILVGSVYMLGMIYFQDHLLPGTRISGFHCDFMTVAEAEDLLNRKVKSYELEIRTRNNGVEAIKASEIGLAYNPSSEVPEILKSQHSWDWFLSLGRELVYETARAVSFDEAALTEEIKGLYCLQPENITAPVDASIKKLAQGYEIVPESEGTSLDYDKVYAAIREAVVSGTPMVDLEELHCYLEPTCRAADPVMQTNLEFIKKISGVVITYDFADRTEVVNEEKIINWIATEEDGSYTLDWDAVADYVADLADRYDTVGRERSFRRYDGADITVSGGDYGWQIDQIHETQGLMDAILAGATQVREPVYSFTAFSRDTNDIGYTYIEINLSTQKLVWYQKGLPQVETYIVSGIPGNSDTMTPTGVYSVQEMNTPATAPREQMGVNWCLSFYYTYSIHDAPWRTDFSQGINVNAGTTGCIHVPSDAMQSLYYGVEPGTPVVIYN